MKNITNFLIVLALPLTLGAGGSFGQSTQTDWSGGPDVAGPVVEFGKQFDQGDLAWGSVFGQVALRSIPRLDFPRETMVADADHPSRLAVADVTGDGMVDVILSNATISPFDPDNRRGGVYLWQIDSEGNWARTVITEDFYGAWHVDTVDLDQDGDLDVIASAFYGEIDPPPPPPSQRNGRFAWFENLDGAGQNWLKREIGELFWGANHIAAGDVDGDGDLDLIGAATLTYGGYVQETDVVWFENEDGAGESWSQHDVSGDFGDAFEVYPVDVDGDSDIDLIASGYNRFEWFENLDGSGDAWNRHEISPTLSGAGYFAVGDLDQDGDWDILGSGFNNSQLGVWKNDGTGLSWDLFLVGGFSRGFNVDLADLDGDGDLDAIASGDGGGDRGKVAFAENLGDGNTWTISYVDNNTPRDPWVRAADVEGDGKLELVASFQDGYDSGVQLAAYTITDFAPAGSLLSSVLDGSSTRGWGAIAWDADVPESTSLAVEVRGSHDAQDLGPFVTVPSSGTLAGSLIDPSARYLQYRITFASEDANVSPVLQEIGIGMDGLVGVESDGTPSAPVPALIQNFPNPFNPRTTIAFDLPRKASVRLAVYDVSGRLVDVILDNEPVDQGRTEVVWQGRDLSGSTVSAGVYFYRLETGLLTETRTMVLVR